MASSPPTASDCLRTGSAPPPTGSPQPPTGSPDDLVWLAGLIARSPLLPDARLRRAWRTVLPWLAVDARYALAATLLRIEQACGAS
jgi:hypothetical protein